MLKRCWRQLLQVGAQHAHQIIENFFGRFAVSRHVVADAVLPSLAQRRNSDRSGVYLQFVVTVSPTRAKIVIIFFAVAMVYASVCSSLCAAGVCPNLEHYSEGHDCDQPSHHHSHGSHNDEQHDPDCKHHAHPPGFALRASGLAPFQGHSTTLLQAAAVLVSVTDSLAISQDILQQSHQRPPDISNASLHQQTSVLRV